MRVVGVRLIGVPFAADRQYDYCLPDRLEEPGLAPGRLLTVPFGRANRRMAAVLTAFPEREACAGLKEVAALTPLPFALSDEMLALALFLHEHTLCSVGDAVRAMLPPAALFPEVTTRIRREAIYSLADPAGLPALLETRGAVRSEGHRRALTALAERGSLTAEELSSLGVSASALTAMKKHGWLSVSYRELFRNPYAGAAGTDRRPITLSRAQGEAYAALARLYELKTPQAALLYGVTGSGKTSVMMKLMDRVIAEGRGVILMVPEIALTPQTVSIFCSRYGERVAVIHSSLSAGERFDAWRRIASGGVDLVIGTRSAVFAPLSDIGLILIDEEHEHTYKSEADPKYHTRDVAAFRAGRHRCLTVMASATPSLESFYKAERGSYTLVPLRERFGANPLPAAEIVDLRAELRRGNTSPYSARLSELIGETTAVGEQTILFLNRRGYHATLHCRGCGHVFECPHCSVSLTHHTRGGGGYLLCHTCGYRAPLPRQCPQCGGEKISYLGAGTQKAESELLARLPEVRLMRMDADTTSTKQAYDRMLEAFRAGEVDVLLGTQMVTKGHDFPKVTLVGVLLADISLHVCDFRAAERTFSLLTQVIGRAGRAAIPGRAVIQTFTPENDILTLACRQDYDTFYRRELALRRELLYPPFCDMVQLTLTGSREATLTADAEALSRLVTERAGATLPGEPMVIYGPFEAQTYKAGERYRMRMVIKCKLNRTTRHYLAGILRDFSGHGDTVLTVDCNPNDV